MRRGKRGAGKADCSAPHAQLLALEGLPLHPQAYSLIQHLLAPLSWVVAACQHSEGLRAPLRKQLPCTALERHGCPGSLDAWMVFKTLGPNVYSCSTMQVHTGIE